MIRGRRFLWPAGEFEAGQISTSLRGRQHRGSTAPAPRPRASREASAGAKADAEIERGYPGEMGRSSSGVILVAGMLAACSGAPVPASEPTPAPDVQPARPGPTEPEVVQDAGQDPPGLVFQSACVDVKSYNTCQNVCAREGRQCDGHGILFASVEGCERRETRGFFDRPCTLEPTVLPGTPIFRCVCR